MLARISFRNTRVLTNNPALLQARSFSSSAASTSSPSPTSSTNQTPKQVYELWRKDDHGLCVYMATYTNLEEANKMCEVFEKRGHRQVYWVEKKDQVADATQRRQR